MARPLTNENELYDKIKHEKITVPLLIWDLMYRDLGDEISAITQIALSYFRYNESIAIDDAKKILEHTKKINEAVLKILDYERIQTEKGEQLKCNNTLNPIINELFFHYIGNDVYGISMIVGFHLDPIDENPIPVEDAQKILDKTATLKQFLDRLREATQQEVSFREDRQ